MACHALRLVVTSTRVAGARRMTETPAAYPVGPAGGYTPADLAHAYGVDPTDPAAASQTVAVVDAFNAPSIKTDLAKFDARYNLPSETAASFKVVNQDGDAKPLPPANKGWSGETSLDVEAVRALCNACRILLVEANQATDYALATAERTAGRLHATVISNSFGRPEVGGTTPYFRNAFNQPGVVIAAATGDDGWYDWDGFNTKQKSGNSPEYPSSFSSVVAVGGTSLHLNPDGSRADETVWNDNGPNDDVGFALKRAMGGGGGGCSTTVPKPAFQNEIDDWASTNCRTMRSVADISAVADPYTGFDVLDSYDGGWSTIGGTSLATPVIAALWGLAGGSGGVSYPAKTLYDNYAHTLPRPTYDVVVGGNGACGGESTRSCARNFRGSPNTWGYGRLDCAFKPNSTVTVAATAQCDARPGYDGPSGVGTPNGLTTFLPPAP